MGWDDRYIRKKREKVEVEKRMVGRGKIAQCHIIRRGFRPYSEDRTFLYQYIFPTMDDDYISDSVMVLHP